MARVSQTPPPPVSVPSTPAKSKVRPTSSGKSRQHAKEFIIIISNLPYRMDAASTIRYRDVYWKPLKDLIRKVINKEDDGRDIAPQVATPSTVNIEHEAPATPATPAKHGHAICSVKQEVLARRALRWLGGNVWYGWQLSVLICCQSAGDCRVIDSRTESMFPNPVDLSQFSKISDTSLLRSPPAVPLPPPFAGAVRPNSRVSVAQAVGMSPQVHPGHTWCSTAGYSATGTGSFSNTTGSFYPPPSHSPMLLPTSTYPSAPDPYTAINIMIRIEDQWRPHGIHPAHPSPPDTPSTNNKPDISTNKTSLSPTAASFASISAISSPPGRTYGPIGSAAPPTTTTTNRQQSLQQKPPQNPSGSSYHAASVADPAASYHVNPATGLPVNTARGTHPVSPSSTLIVRNLHHRTSAAQLKAFFGSVCLGGTNNGSTSTGGSSKPSTAPLLRLTITRAEVRETPGQSRKKVIGLVGFAGAEDARRARDAADGILWEGRRLGVGICRDDEGGFGRADIGAGAGVGAGDGDGDMRARVGEERRGEKGGNGEKGDWERENGEDRDVRGETGARGPVIANGSEEDEGSD